MFKKGLVAFVILLFLGLAIAPSINANVSKQDDLVELDVELCGLGKKHTVKLTQEEYNEVELIFEEIQERLSDVQSDYKAISIINNAIIKMKKYGLFGDLSVKQVQSLIITPYQFLKNDKLIQKSLNIDKTDNNANYLCFISGKLTGTRVQKILPRIFGIMIEKLVFIFSNQYLIYKFLSWILFPYLLIICPIRTRISTYNPVSFFSTVGAGWKDGDIGGIYYYTSKVNLNSYGLLGNVKWNEQLYGNASKYLMHCDGATGTYYPALIGFSGIKISTFPVWRVSLFGFSLKTRFSSVPPDLQLI